MKIKRVIRFDDEPALQAHHTKQPQDTSSIECIPREETRFQHSQEFIPERRQERYGQQNFSVNPIESLTRSVEMVIASRASTNMIGVFGINSDDVVNQFISNLTNNQNSVIYIGDINYSFTVRNSNSITADVYNAIAARLIKYMQDTYNYNRNYDLQYYFNQIYQLLSDVYDNQGSYEDEYAYSSPLTSLARMGYRYERDRNLLAAIGQLKQVVTASRQRSDNAKFLITMSLEEVNYRVLNNLSKLNSSDLIIVIYTISSFELAREEVRHSTGVNCIDKFFKSENYVRAD